MFDNILDAWEKESKSELTALKIQWEGIKLQLELEKAKHPEVADKIDNYFNSIKSLIRNEIMNDDDFDEQDLADYKYVFGEDDE